MSFEFLLLDLLRLTSSICQTSPASKDRHKISPMMDNRKPASSGCSSLSLSQTAIFITQLSQRVERWALTSSDTKQSLQEAEEKRRDWERR